MSENLSKKQQKAANFRAKQKAKKRGDEEPEDVPEQDLQDDVEVAVSTKETKGKEGKGEKKDGKEKKRKREESDDSEEAEADDASAKAKSKAKGKGKAKTAWDEEEDKEKTKKDIKQRFILFVGNLGFKTTRDEVAKHFSEAAGRTPAVRLLTEKPQPGSKAPPKSRGIAFVELSSSTEMQACLRLHHSILNARRINVELTAGGGGKSEARKGKIAERNKRVGGQRERREDKEVEKEAKEKGVSVETVREAKVAQATQAQAAAEQEMEESKKTRNGRRVRSNRDGPPNKRSKTDGGRRKWEPTGANAVAVGK